jgi:hypothetical protein
VGAIVLLELGEGSGEVCDDGVRDTGRGEHIVFESFLVFPMVREVTIIVEVFF